MNHYIMDLRVFPQVPHNFQTQVMEIAQRRTLLNPPLGDASRVAQGASVLVGRTLIAPKQPVVMEGWEAKEIKKIWNPNGPNISTMHWYFHYPKLELHVISISQFRTNLYVAILLQFASSNSRDIFVLASVLVTLAFASVCLLAESQWYLSTHSECGWPGIPALLFQEPCNNSAKHL